MIKLNKILQDQSGQMAIFVMLILVVALTVGLTVVTRTITNTRLSTNTELSSRAYSAAEAGIEEALRLGSTPADGTVGAGNSQANYKVSQATEGGTGTAYAFPVEVAKDDTVQVWLFDFDYYKNNITNSNPFPTYNETTTPSGYYYGNQLTLYWGSSYAPNTTVTPALEATLIYKDSSGFGVEKYAYDSNSGRAISNKFSTLAAGTEYSSTFANTSTTQGLKQYFYKKTISLPNQPARNYLLLRLKLLYNTDRNHQVAVGPVSGKALPSQGQVIESEGRAGDVVRKLRVYQSYPALPNIFDFVLFNGSTNPLQK